MAAMPSAPEGKQAEMNSNALNEQQTQTRESIITESAFGKNSKGLITKMERRDAEKRRVWLSAATPEGARHPAAGARLVPRLAHVGQVNARPIRMRILRFHVKARLWILRAAMPEQDQNCNGQVVTYEASKTSCIVQNCARAD
eukprot:5752440-Pleurochrysis_carterae.AAC.2